MKIHHLFAIVLSLFIIDSSYAQFHNYDYKYGIQGHLLQPSTEFDGDSYRLSLLGRGFLRVELNSYLEAELGVGIGELNGKDFDNENWSTLIYPTDIRLLFSPFASETSNPYLYTGVSLLRWKVTDLPFSVSPNESDNIGWNSSLPIGVGIEIAISQEILFDVSGGYTFAFTDNLNYYNSPDKKDGYFDFGFGLTFVTGSGENDEDKDGIVKSVELQLGTDPKNNDSDSDLLLDGEEINIFNTNPTKKDSDSDGLNDYDEINTYYTDPNSVDTDGDNISDFEEIEKYSSNPSLKDSDFDKLSDGYEVNVYNTNPTKKDTDGDRLDDNDELHKYKTDPVNIDTDSDGLTDGEEIIKYKTNPLIKDSDKILNNKKEQELEFNSETPLILKGITFETNEAKILPESEEILNKTYLSLLKDPTLRIEIRGHTDNVGNADYNIKLSLERAEAVRIWLVKKGIDALRIKAIGFGESNPISDNSTPEGRNNNRRIEIINQ